MKLISKSALIAVSLFPAAALPAAAASRSGVEGTVEIVNSHSSASVDAFWVARAGEPNDPWDSVKLNYAIGPKSYTTVGFTNVAVCLYDMKVKFDDGAVQTFGKVNICKGEKIVAW